MENKANLLIEETSPYLLQHAYNPVAWHAWNLKTLQKAKDEQKLILVSIGYATCHWCHVMERESFENEEVAAIMNQNFICIKVDREERPDVDQLYMDAVQLMTGRGGWPLNAVALPDGRPIWGGTYFRPQAWVDALKKIARLYKEKPEDVAQYAANLTSGIKQMSLVPVEKSEVPFSLPELEAAFFNIENQFDTLDGGMNRVPKFPMPNNYTFLMQYHKLTDKPQAWEQTALTLDKMAKGGIFDQLEGGFSRYSVDGIWKVPHFEKMLYDNALLIGLYADAYAHANDELYKTVVELCYNYLIDNMLDSSGGFYCGLDADSEGVEGKYYVWTKDEFLEVITEDKFLLYSYWQLEENALWEEGNNILMPVSDEAAFCQEHQISQELLREKVERARKLLLAKRKERIAPSLDNKILLSWNALLVSGLLKCYAAFGNEKYLTTAQQIIDFINLKMRDENGYYRTYQQGKAKISAFLEDYAFLVEALLDLYQTTGKLQYLNQAKEIVNHLELKFKHEKDSLFHFSPINQQELAASKIDFQDNVMPSPNSVMAHNYFTLGKLTAQLVYIDKSRAMLNTVIKYAKKDSGFYSNWLSLYAKFISNFQEIVIIGPKHQQFAQEICKQFWPFKVLVYHANGNTIPLTESRGEEGKTVIYACKNGSCSLPVYSVSELKF